MNGANQRRTLLPLRGLEPEADYLDVESGKRYTGDTLLTLGIPVELKPGDLQSVSICVHKLSCLPPATYRSLLEVPKRKEFPYTKI